MEQEIFDTEEEEEEEEEVEADAEDDDEPQAEGKSLLVSPVSCDDVLPAYPEEPSEDEAANDTPSERDEL